MALRYSGLPSGSRLVGLVLSTWWDTEGSPRAPSLPELAAAADVHVATVKRELKRLEEAGWIERSAGGGRGRTTIYRAAPEIPAAAEAELEKVLSSGPQQPPLMATLGAGKPAQGAPVSGRKPAQGVIETGAHDSQTGAQGAGFRAWEKRSVLPSYEAVDLPADGPEKPAQGAPVSRPPWIEAGMTWAEWRDLPEDEQKATIEAAEWRAAEFGEAASG